MYSNEEGAAKCTVCGVGTAGNGCQPCARGEYRDRTNNATKCLKCPAGYISETKGSGSCLPCIPGEFQKYAGLWACNQCNFNEYSKSVHSTSCLPCKLGELTTEKGSAACSKCDVGMFGDWTAGECVNCPAGYYQDGKGAIKVCYSLTLS